MKQIWKYLVAYAKQELKPAYFISVVLLLALSIYFEYTYKLEKTYVHIHYGKHLPYFVANVIMYGVPFLGTYLLYILFYKRFDLLKNSQFLGLLFFALIIYCFRSSWYEYRTWFRLWFSSEYSYLRQSFQEIMQGMLVFVPVLFFWWFRQRAQMPLYGFRLKGVDVKPYFLLLLLVFPFIAWASFQSDFLSMYPQYHDSRILPDGLSIGERVFRILVFELCYGFDFVMTEFFFRGFLILAFAKYVGKGCILPMVSFYVFIHFGKPMNETISSFFGGLILGVIAYESRSIVGGIIAHLGVAWMMEAGGTVGRFFFPGK